MTGKQDNFYAKVLLFGEYSILLGSSALSIPYGHFQASLSFIQEDKYTDLELAKRSNTLLRELLLHYRSLPGLSSVLDLAKMSSDIEAGLYLESNIPQGYGLGSSGALCAALYGRYALNPVLPAASIGREDIGHLKELFALMESWFHGRSSGFDPLSIYLRYPLYMDPDGHPSVVGIPRNWKGEASGIFLLDTGRPGKTSPLVSYFLDHFAPGGNISPSGTELCRLSNSAIDSLLRGEMPEFWGWLKALSAFQMEQMPEMIPPTLLPQWGEGLRKDLFYLKLCGSGGGGFLAGFAHDFPAAIEWFRELRIPLIPVYQASGGR